MRVLVVAMFSVLTACASVRSSIHVTGVRGRASRRPVPVFYALAPPFAYETIGEVRASARSEQAHIDELIAEAEARAEEVGADAIVIHDIVTDARSFVRRVWHTCSGYGPGGRIYQYTCPGYVNTLTVESYLVATAVRRTGEVRPPPSAGAWPVPPPTPPPAPLPPPAPPEDDEEPFDAH